MGCIICEPVITFLFFLLINFVNLFHPQFISQFGLSDFPYLSFVAIHFVTETNDQQPSTFRRKIK